MELMVVIAIIAILSAIALPGYQRYLDRAALTDMLRIASPYRLAVELCAMQQGDAATLRRAAISPRRVGRYSRTSNARMSNV